MSTQLNGVNDSVFAVKRCYNYLTSTAGFLLQICSNFNRCFQLVDETQLRASVLNDCISSSTQSLLSCSIIQRIPVVDVPDFWSVLSAIGPFLWKSLCFVFQFD